LSIADDDDEDESRVTADASTEQLRSQLYTLTTSLSTVTEEKSKMAATYQAEKKKLRVILPDITVFFGP